MIVSGPLCADAADCRLLASVLFGEELAAGDAGRAADRDRPRHRHRRRRPGRPRRLRGGDRGAASPRPAASWSRSSWRTSSRRRWPAVLIANTEGLARAEARASCDSLDPGLSPIARGLLKYRMLLPAAATAKAREVRTLMRRRLAAVFAEVDVIAWPTVPASAPPLEAPVVELPSGTHTADQANVRGAALANLTGVPAISVPVGSTTGCRSACSCRPPGGATRCCSTPPRRWSGPTGAAGSRRCRRWPRPRRAET